MAVCSVVLSNNRRYSWITQDIIDMRTMAKELGGKLSDLPMRLPSQEACTVAQSSPNLN